MGVKLGRVDERHLDEKQKRGVAITLWLDPEVVGEVDALAEKLQITRSRVVRNLMLCGLDDARVLDRLGLWDVMMWGKTMLQKKRELISGGSYEVTA